MIREIGKGRLALVVAVVGVLGIAGCESDKGPNSETPLEAARYPAMEAYLDSAFAEFCNAFEDALAAQVDTDTAHIPGIVWPFEMPPRRRDGNTNLVDENTSWGVSYNRPIAGTTYAAFWDLGRLVDTGRIGFDSPILATIVEHKITFARLDGFGDDEISREAVVRVSLSDLDDPTSHLSASFTAGRSIVEGCGGLPCDAVDIDITDGQFQKVGEVLDLSTLTGTVTGTVKFTEFDVIMGHDAIFIWTLSGTISNGVATVTASSSQFSATSDYPLCP